MISIGFSFDPGRGEPTPAEPASASDRLEAWWTDLTEEEQESIDAAVEILEERGPALGRPLADIVRQSRHQHMKELRPTSIRRGWPFS